MLFHVPKTWKGQNVGEIFIMALAEQRVHHSQSPALLTHCKLCRATAHGTPHGACESTMRGSTRTGQDCYPHRGHSLLWLLCQPAADAPSDKHGQKATEPWQAHGNFGNRKESVAECVCVCVCGCLSQGPHLITVDDTSLVRPCCSPTFRGYPASYLKSRATSYGNPRHKAHQRFTPQESEVWKFQKSVLNRRMYHTAWT